MLVYVAYVPNEEMHPNKNGDKCQQAEEKDESRLFATNVTKIQRRLQMRPKKVRQSMHRIHQTLHVRKLPHLKSIPWTEIRTKVYSSELYIRNFAVWLSRFKLSRVRLRALYIQTTNSRLQTSSSKPHIGSGCCSDSYSSFVIVDCCTRAVTPKNKYTAESETTRTISFCSSCGRTIPYPSPTIKSSTRDHVLRIISRMTAATSA